MEVERLCCSNIFDGVDLPRYLENQHSKFYLFTDACERMQLSQPSTKFSNFNSSLH